MDCGSLTLWGVLLLLAVTSTAVTPDQQRYSCVVCDTLVERVVLRVVEAIQEQPFELRTAQKTERSFDPTSIIDAMISEDAAADAPSFAADCRENLRNQRGLFLKALRGRPVAPSQIFGLKKKICGV